MRGGRRGGVAVLSVRGENVAGVGERCLLANN